MLAQYIVPISSFNCGHIHISSRIQIRTIDVLPSDLVYTSGLVNSEFRKEVVRAVPSRVPVFTPLRSLVLKA
jgi:hypothetical protein